MKRWIHASVASPDLSYTYNGKTYYLPEWCKDWSRDDIEQAKKDAIAGLEYPDPNAYKDEPRYSEEDLYDIEEQLRHEGYSRREIDQIIEDVLSGRTLDSAIQKLDM